MRSYTVKRQGIQGNYWYWARLNKPISTPDGFRYKGTLLYQTAREAELVLLKYLKKIGH